MLTNGNRVKAAPISWLKGENLRAVQVLQEISKRYLTKGGFSMTTGQSMLKALSILIIALSTIQSAKGVSKGPFLNFLTNRPPVEIVVFRYINLQNPITTSSSQTNLYYGSWSKDGFFLRNIERLTEIGQPASKYEVRIPFVGESRDVIWSFNRNFCNQAPKNQLPKARNADPIAPTVNAGKLILNRVLCAGIPCSAESLVESGKNGFEVESNGEGMVRLAFKEFAGKIVGAESYFKNEPQPAVETAYEYSTTNSELLTFFPSVINTFLRHKGIRYPTGRIEILKLKVSPEPLSVSTFEPQNFYRPDEPSAIKTILVSNGQMYATGSAGLYQLESPSKLQRNPRKITFIVFAITILTLPVFVVFLKIKKKQNYDQQK